MGNDVRADEQFCSASLKLDKTLDAVPLCALTDMSTPGCSHHQPDLSPLDGLALSAVNSHEPRNRLAFGRGWSV